MALKYKMNRVQPDSVRRICERYAKGDLLLANILARRGVERADDMKWWLEKGVNWLHSPFLFSDMRDAVDRILAAAEEGEKVAVFGDRDADGITSSAILVSEFRRMGIDTMVLLPEGDEPYGLTKEAVEKIREAAATLIVTCDNGISCREEVDLANSYGIDVIVTDHHLAPGDDLPDALAIIDPKAPSCGYPFEHLAGCAVAAKLVWALRFAKTPWYGSAAILLHAEPGPGDNTTTIVQAVELRDLAEVDRVVEELPNGSVDFNSSRLVRMLTKGCPVLVLDKDLELRQLRMAFGPSVDIALVDVRPQIEATVPKARGRKLVELSAFSRASAYADGHREIECLVSLFVSSCVYGRPELSSGYLDVLDLAAIGTIADMMPLSGENRTIVRMGLERLSQKPRENLVQLLSAQNLLGRPLTSQDIAWYVSPVFNAAGRLGCPKVALDLLLTDDPTEMMNLTEKLLALNKERQRMGDEAWDRVSRQGKESYESYGSKFALLDTGDIPRGLTGALATKALKEFPSAPAVIALSAAEDGRLSGSMRSRDSLNCRDFLSKLSGHLIDFGGHARAGGFSMEEGGKEGFLKDLEEIVLSMDADELAEELVVDSLVGNEDMGKHLMDIVELFEPYGESNPPLVFLHQGGEVVDIITLGDATKGNIKLSVRMGARVWPCLWWGAKKDPSFDIRTGDRLRMVFRMGRNWYKGMDSIQLTILQAEKTD